MRARGQFHAYRLLQGIMIPPRVCANLRSQPEGRFGLRSHSGLLVTSPALLEADLHEAGLTMPTRPGPVRLVSDFSLACTVIEDRMIAYG